VEHVRGELGHARLTRELHGTTLGLLQLPRALLDADLEAIVGLAQGLVGPRELLRALGDPPSISSTATSEATWRAMLSANIPMKGQSSNRFRPAICCPSALIG
jgi:hypothetical protein